MKIDPARFTHLARIAFSIADPAGPSIEAAIAAAHAAGLPEEAIAETILQGIPYSGFPGAVEALGSLRTLEESGARRDETSDPAPRTSETPSAFTAVYRDGAPAVRKALRDRHPALERWIIDFAYGEVMGRSIFTMFELEGLAVASLIAQRRKTPLHSHLRGALRNGWTGPRLTALVEALGRDADASTLAFAHSVITREAGAPGL